MGLFFIYKIALDGGLPPFVIVLGRVSLAAIMLKFGFLLRGRICHVLLLSGVTLSSWVL